MKKKGADWVHKHCDLLSNIGRKIPILIVRKISSMAKARSNLLISQRKATEKEVEDIENLQGKKIARPHYLNEQLAEIQGLEALYPENDLRKLLILDLEQNIRDFKNKKIDQLTYTELAKWKKWTVSIELTLERASEAIVYGCRLLDGKNLNPFLKILEVDADRELFRAYLEQIKVME